ncbi:MAG: FkbM family methyltransferase [Phycisphaerae bacterium]
MAEKLDCPETCRTEAASEQTVRQLRQRIEKDPSDIQAVKQLGRIALDQGQLADASHCFKQALQADSDDLDALLGLAGVCLAAGLTSEADYLLEKASTLDHADPSALEQIRQRYAASALQAGASENPEQPAAKPVKSARIAVFCGADGMTFLKDILEQIGPNHEIRVFGHAGLNHKNQREYLELLAWCDVAWFEWATNLAAVFCTVDPKPSCHVILRLHRYEAYAPGIQQIHWSKIDTLITVGNPAVLDQLRQVAPEFEQTVNHVTIPNGVDLDRFSFTPRLAGKQLAFVANMRMVKNVPLLLQCMHQLVKKDPSYQLSIAGRLDDPQLTQYTRHMIDQFGLGENVRIDGYVSDISAWLSDKQYIVCTSLIESQGMGIMEAMARGLKPVIHHFPGAEEIYNLDWLFLTPEQFCRQITEGPFDSMAYRRYVEENYSLAQTCRMVESLIASAMETLDKPGKAAEAEGSTPPPGQGKYHRNLVQFGRHKVELWDYEGNHLSRMMRSGQFYEYDLLAFLYRRYGTGGVYVDIGACIGNHTMFFAKVCQADRVVAVEPTPETFMLLEHNRQVNRAENVELIEAGISDKPGWAEVEVVRESNRGMNRLHAVEDGPEGPGRIRLIRGDSLDVENIKLMKIDVEGMVQQVVNSCRELIQRDHPVIVAEVEDEPEVYQLLTSMGYRVAGKFCATETCVFESQQ